MKIFCCYFLPQLGKLADEVTLPFLVPEVGEFPSGFFRAGTDDSFHDHADLIEKEPTVGAIL